MGQNSKIEWTHSTFNPWWGCTRVSPGCDHCYAAALDHRYGGEHWGAHAARRFFSDAHWAEPRRWDRDAARAGERRRVFCASMADVLESRPDLTVPRGRLWELIRGTEYLDWLLLTKRPHNARSMIPESLATDPRVWLGTTAEDQARADQRIPKLIETPARIRWLSVEPLLGPIDLRSYLPSIDWVIVGGESGGGSRRMDPEWARDIQRQCADSGVAFHFKQWGDFDPEGRRIGKKYAGRDLYPGVTFDELPAARLDSIASGVMRRFALTA